MVVVDPPAYVTDELGQRPSDDLHRQGAWDRGARTIESYRQRAGVVTQPGLGPIPRDPGTRWAYHTASRELGVARVEIGQRDVSVVDVTRGYELW